MSSRRCRARCVDARRCRGVALITVTWLLALIALLAGASLTIVRTSSRLAANRLEIVQAELLADAAIRRALLSLLAERPQDRWPIGGTAVPFAYAGKTFSVRIAEESGRIDINGADADLLAAAFAANGVEIPQARAIAARMIDWRDADDAVTTQGAELHEYRTRASGYGPRNGPFESPDEMWLVLDMPRGLRARLEPLFTAFTGQSGVDPSASSEPVRAVLSWAAEHRWAGRQWTSAVATRAESERAAGGRVFRISAEHVDDDAQPAIRREAVVRITGNLRQPSLVYSWRTLHVANRAAHD